MSWRHQLEGLICAIFLLASILAIAVRPLALRLADVEFKVRLSTQQEALARSSGTTIRNKVPRVTTPQSFSLASPNDEGSLWEDGPAYNLSDQR
jgi:hypothetical protein